MVERPYTTAELYSLGRPDSTGNKYLKDHSSLSKEEIIEKYCLFLSIQTDKNSFHIIKNENDIDNIIASNDNMRSYQNAFPDKYNIITYKNIDFSGSDDSIIYCWFINKGVVKFMFKLNNTFVESVESDIIGYLGVEVVDF